MGVPSWHFCVAGGDVSLRCFQGAASLAGIRTLLQVFDGHHGVRPVLGPVELCMNRCVLLAAECLIAALAGPREQVGCTAEPARRDKAPTSWTSL